MQVCSNGVISIGSGHFTFFSPSRFPGSSVVSSFNVLAPYWNDHDLRAGGGAINYNVYTVEMGSEAISRINIVSSLISNQRGMNFSGIWMLVAEWSDVQSYPAASDSERTNTYQATVITDGMLTFAVYTYSCSQLRWTSGLGSNVFSVIGYNINSENVRFGSLEPFGNHPLSSFSAIDSVACANNDMRVDTANLIYLVGNDTGDLQAARSDCIKRASLDQSQFSSQRRYRLSCPCSVFQALRDSRYIFVSSGLLRVTGDQRFSSSSCFIPRFSGNRQDVQMCCYSRK